MTAASRPSGTRLPAGAAWHILLAALAAPTIAAQAVPRADLPGRGAVRVTFDPRVEWWDENFVDGTRVRIGVPLTGDSVRSSPALPDVALLESNIRAAGAYPGFSANLGKGRLSVLQQRRVTPITLEYGVLDHLSLGVTVPLVRVYSRQSFELDTTGSNLGLNPLLTDPDAGDSYAAFFAGFATALANVESSLGCPASPQCAAAQPFLADAHGVADALARTVYGTGSGGGVPFLPLAGTAGATAVDSNLARIQRDLQTYGDSTFTVSFLFPAAAVPLDTDAFAIALTDASRGFGARAFGDTPLRERYWLGDVEVAARYQVVHRPAYVATVGFTWRLPTGHRAAADDPLGLAAGDGQTDFEGQLVQELTLWRRLWLNLSLRAGLQQPGSGEWRVAPAEAFLVRPQTRAALTWDPGDYLAIDFAPLYRFHRRFAAGVTLGYFRKAEDHYTFRVAQDSIDLAARVGVPLSASLRDAGTAQQVTRAGIAVSYIGPWLETGFSAEQTVSAGSGRAPAPWVFRLVLRVQRKLF